MDRFDLRLAALASLIASRDVAHCAALPVGIAMPVALAAAYGTCEVLLYAATWALPSGPGAFAPKVVLRILLSTMPRLVFYWPHGALLTLPRSDCGNSARVSMMVDRRPSRCRSFAGFKKRLAELDRPYHVLTMFVVIEADAAAIRLREPGII